MMHGWSDWDTVHLPAQDRLSVLETNAREIDVDMTGLPVTKEMLELTECFELNWYTCPFSHNVRY